MNTLATSPSSFTYNSQHTEKKVIKTTELRDPDLLQLVSSLETKYGMSIRQITILPEERSDEDVILDVNLAGKKLYSAPNRDGGRRWSNYGRTSKYLKLDY